MAGRKTPAMGARPNLYTGHRLPPRTALGQMLFGVQVRQVLFVAARLGIADLLAEGPRSAAELASRSGADEAALYRVLRALCAIGIFSWLGDGRFELTPLGQLLRSGVHGSLRAVAGHSIEGGRAFAELLHSVRTGEPAFNRAFGVSLFDYLAQEPDVGISFDGSMESRTVGVADATLAAYDFSRYRTVVDVGGGTGVFLMALLAAYPAVRGVILERPAVAERARRRITAAGFGERCTVTEGDFFDSVPPGGDAYVLSRVIHDWDDERASAILVACRDAMSDGAKLVLLEAVVPTDAIPPLETAMFDINMLVMTGGRERTEAEFRALFASAGLRLTRIIESGTPVSVIEGTAA